MISMVFKNGRANKTRFQKQYALTSCDKSRILFQLQHKIFLPCPFVIKAVYLNSSPKPNHLTVLLCRSNIYCIGLLFRYNKYKTDPLSKCQGCNPPYSAENAISARSDLNPADGKYPISALGHRRHGGTDCKVKLCQTSMLFSSLVVFSTLCYPLQSPQTTFSL